MGEFSLNTGLFSVVIQAPEEVKGKNKSEFEIKQHRNEAYHFRKMLKQSLKIKSGTITSKLFIT